LNKNEFIDNSKFYW